MKIPFGTITITDRAKELIVEALDQKRISSGKLVREFEDGFARLVGAREAVAVSSGTDADILALAVLHDLGAKRGDEVIVPSLSFVATGNAVLHAGFTPVFVDIERDTLNIDHSRIEAAITPRTRAILPVHLMGKPAEMDTINAIAKAHGLLVVEDAAEAHGASYKGRSAGTLADLAAFSTYVAHIITTGEGGVVTTDNEEYGEILRSLRSHGRNCTCKHCILNAGADYCAKRFRGPGGEDVRFTFDRIGYSCKMNELEAAIGIGALEFYREILGKRHQNLLHVLERFDRFAPFLSSIKEEPHEKIGPHAIPIVINEGAPFTRSELTRHLEERGIETRTLFVSMPTQCPGFAPLGYRLGQFPNAEYLGQYGLHIGVHQDLGLEEMDYILNVIDLFLARYR
ncbi:aminotransferase DegT [Geomonas limicola]|uniref:Aminotransferase DegT n=1 Tax=Geomonas limicola TaxID=2740186 RepID=A0A6V8N7H8_9BACT|nr:DegT/DnrJ/EryC1/StrS family aminotransferase [Geomonas limicola]GFO68512.1 aminotransferase DegT [Geomonas limicola]